MNKLLFTLSLCVMFIASNPVNAAVLTFDDYAPDAVDFESITELYGGLSWDYTSVNNVTHYNDTNGYVVGTVSGNFVGFNEYENTITSQSAQDLFTFNGAYLTAAWRDNLEITVRGFNGDNLLFDNTVIVSAYTPEWYNFDYVGINKLVFSPFGGVEVPEYNGTGTHFAMDNFTINEPPAPAPEPSTMLLGLMGVPGLLRRKNKQK